MSDDGQTGAPDGPPEDIGGPPGFEMFKQAMADPKHPEHANLKEWFGSTFEPDTPESDELRLEVLKLAERWKPRKPKRTQSID